MIFLMAWKKNWRDILIKFAREKKGSGKTFKKWNKELAKKKSPCSSVYEVVIETEKYEKRIFKPGFHCTGIENYRSDYCSHMHSAYGNLTYV